MSDIKLAARLANLFRGFMSLWITDVEKQHPEIAYQNRIDAMMSQHSRLKDVTAAVIRRRETIDANLNKAQRELTQVAADLEAALATNQDELAMILIQKKEALEASIQALSADLAEAQKDADEAKASLNSMKAEIQKLNAERDAMLAKFQSAQARIQIQDQLEGLSIDAEVRALDNVREHINNTVARAKLGDELKESDLDTQLAKLRQTSGSINARAKLDQLKQARAGNSQASSNKTL
ncbi:PspA/IM30 family protein [Chitinibacter sp. SCUT-21]|uniref:PspA/IM30 family protein n=1 Tax=Chitinibacter sp. SCUT-21 TaxID=2970891 RepID=UPI0035A708AD